jgi:hypothetical protein
LEAEKIARKSYQQLLLSYIGIAGSTIGFQKKGASVMVSRQDSGKNALVFHSQASLLPWKIEG